MYIIEKNCVSFGGNKIKDVKPELFQILSDGYALYSNKYGYYNGVKMGSSELNKFMVLGDGYAKCSVYGYFKGKKIEKVDKSEYFEVYSNGYATYFSLIFFYFF
jgi:hypothetical protein